MCGICGVVQVGGELRRVLAPGVIDRMTDSMTHRGPNDRGTYEADGVALGVRRLSIVDVAGGHQPVTSEDGRVVAVQNGELYNHLDVRRQLERSGHTFRSGCDTDVIPHLYEDSGPAFEERLTGKFAIAVWDERRRSAVVARDRLGIKPLYYARCGDLLVFGSEMKAVMASGLVSTELDYEAIDIYLTLSFFPGGRTPLAGVRKLEPGHRLEIGGGDGSRRALLGLPRARAGSGLARGGRVVGDPARPARRGDERPADERRAPRRDAERRARFEPHRRAHGEAHERAGEDVRDRLLRRGRRQRARRRALRRRTRSAPTTTSSSSPTRATSSTFPTFSGTWTSPSPTFRLSGSTRSSRMASEHVTVALSGQGADELFGGYRKHRAAALVGSWRRTLGPAAGPLGRLAGRFPGRATAALAAADPVERLLATSGQLDPDLRAELARGPLADIEPGAAERAIRAELGDVPDDPLPAMLYLDGRLALVDDMVHYFDRASMAHSLEVRVPFLDHRVVEFCATDSGGSRRSTAARRSTS